MPKKNPNKSQRAQRAPNSIQWQYYILTLGCGLLLVGGFFFAARQHFSSIDFGIKNSRLRKQLEDLESDKRRLILAKEIAMSPTEIKKAAQKFGFRETTAGNETAKLSISTLEKPKTTDNKSSQPSAAKTAEVNKPEKEVKVERKLSPDGEKKDKSNTQIARR